MLRGVAITGIVGIEVNLRLAGGSVGTILHKFVSEKDFCCLLDRDYT